MSENITAEEPQAKKIATLSVEPRNIELEEGTKFALNIETNARRLTYEVADEKIATVNQYTKIVRGVTKGETTVTIKTNDARFEEKSITITINVSKGVERSEFNPLIANTYHYNDPLPISTHGAICYKTGDSEDYPLIKLCFNASRKKWDVIGIRMTKYNKNNEPYDFYFLASDEQVDAYLNNLSLDNIVLSLVYDALEQYEDVIKGNIEIIFNKEIVPLIKKQTTQLPDFIKKLSQQEFKKQIDGLFEQALDRMFSDQIRRVSAEELKKYHHDIRTPLKEEELPKWVGMMYCAENLKYGAEKGEIMARRLNTNGIEEYFLNSFQEKINEHTNEDELTRLFDKVEPYKSMERLEFMMEDLKVMEDNYIYSSEAYNELRNKHYERYSKHFNGSFIAGFTNEELYNRDSAWVVPIKKTYYIDVAVKVPATYNKDVPPPLYYIKAVGGEEFTIDLKKYLPDAEYYELYYIESHRHGMFSFVPMESEVYVDRVLQPDKTKGLLKAVIHPAFLDYKSFYTRDPDKGTVYSKAEARRFAFSYIYVGAFLGVETPLTDNTRTSRTKQSYIVLPKPMQWAFSNKLYFPDYNKQGVLSIYPENELGVNFRHIPHTYYHLVELLQTIERGNPAINIYSEPYRSYKWGIIRDQDRSSRRLWNGSTWLYHNKSAKALSVGWCHLTYRGIENFQNFYTYIEGLVFQKMGDHWMAKAMPPYSHKNILNFHYDEDGWRLADNLCRVYFYSAWNSQNKVRAISNTLLAGDRAFEYNVVQNGDFYDYSLDTNRGESYAYMARGFQAWGSGWHILPLTWQMSYSDRSWSISCRPCI